MVSTVCQCSGCAVVVVDHIETGFIATVIAGVGDTCVCRNAAIQRNRNFLVDRRSGRKGLTVSKFFV